MNWIRRHRKGLIATIIIVGVLGGLIFSKFRNKLPDIVTQKVEKTLLRQTVLATGQVTSQTDLSLSFKGSGIVQKVNVKVGQKVGPAEVLASLDQKDQLASLTSARASLASAQANYQKLLDGASSEEVLVASRQVDSAEVVLDNAQQSLITTKQQQQVLVSNAFKALLNSTPAAIPSPGNLGSSVISVTGTYSSNEAGSYYLSIVSTGNGQKLHISGLESGEAEIKSTPVAIGLRGLFVQFSSSQVYSGIDTWTITLPNTQASNYITNLNAYQAALETQRAAVTAADQTVRNAEASLQQARANLELKKAAARPADLDVAKAQILSATGQVQAAESALENTLLRAPSSGTVTVVDVKVGELAQALKQIMVLQDVENLHIEANVSEANIANVKIGQKVELTFDALGPDDKFTGTVQEIDPASTVVSGVVNYKVTAGIDKVDSIKPGMTANLTVLVNEKADVLVVPSRSVIVKDSAKVVRVVDDINKHTYHEVDVETGLDGDGGLVEIVRGLNEGDDIVTLVK